MKPLILAAGVTAAVLATASATLLVASWLAPPTAGPWLGTSAAVVGAGAAFVVMVGTYVLEAYEARRKGARR